MTKRPFFLLSNDDGIDAPGMAALRRAVEGIGGAIVAAPDHERSAGGHAVTLKREIAVQRRGPAEAPWGWAVNGSPADCVKIALCRLLDRRPDWVISGINSGMNAGNSVFYSGTVAAAKEGAMCGLPSVAISMHRRGNVPVHWETGEEVTRRLLPWLLAHPPAPRTVVNINIPNVEFKKLRGVRATRMGESLFLDDFTEISRLDGRAVFSNTGDQFQPSPRPEGMDDGALAEDCVAVTVLRLDMTDEAWLREAGPALERESARLGFGAPQE